jgi:hypothetical protein
VSLGKELPKVPSKRREGLRNVGNSSPNDSGTSQISSVISSFKLRARVYDLRK